MSHVIIRNRVQPIEIPHVNEIHYPQIFGDWWDVIDAKISELEHQPKPGNQVMIDFLRFLRKEVTSDQYAKIQQIYVTEQQAASEANPQALKFIDSIHWFQGKLNAATRICLDKSPPLSILDFGTGCGHFPVVARFFGHEVLGTDVELVPDVPGQELHIYDALCNLFGVKKKVDRIDPFTDVTDFGDRFDYVTGFMTAFNVFEDGSPWSIDAWKYFFGSLQKNVLKPDGKIYFQLTNGKITDEVWDFIKAKADWAHDQSRFVLISNIDG